MCFCQIGNMAQVPLRQSPSGRRCTGQVQAKKSSSVRTAELEICPDSSSSRHPGGLPLEQPKSTRFQCRDPRFEDPWGFNGVPSFGCLSLTTGKPRARGYSRFYNSISWTHSTCKNHTHKSFLKRVDHTSTGFFAQVKKIHTYGYISIVHI